MKKITGIISALLLMFNALAQIETGELVGGDKDALNTITTAVPFLLIAPDSKSGAMGDVGVALDLSVHDLDVLNYLFGIKVSSL